MVEWSIIVDENKISGKGLKQLYKKLFELVYDRLVVMDFITVVIDGVEYKVSDFDWSDESFVLRAVDHSSKIVVSK